MPSLTTWQRLEPIPRSDDLRIGLRAEIADPLWLLARQRQFGELTGEDAGSPVETRFTATVGRISRLHRGPLPSSQASNRSVDIDDRSAPLEVEVEREPLATTTGDGSPAELRLAVEAGLHFLRLLRVNRAASQQARYRTHYAFTASDFPDETGSTAVLAGRAVGRVPDGRRLYQDLDGARAGADELTQLPTEPAVPAGQADKVLAAANRFLDWWEDLVSEPPAGARDSWVPSHLEHSFAVQADLPDGRVVLLADQYRGGRLDWHSFQAAGSPSLGDAEEVRPAEPTVRTVIPTPVSYGGMPANRFWEIEDGTVRFGGLTTGRTDLARLLLTEFALTYGVDWFVVPIDLPVGSVCRVDGVEVVDTFGETTSVPRSVDSSWRLFEIDAPNGPARVRELFFLAPTLHLPAESPPIEEVAMIRDEMANVVWGVERRVQNAAGDPVDRHEEHQLRVAAQQRIDVDHGDAQLLYRLATDVPHHWYPFVPVRAPGAAATAGAVVLERRPLIRVMPDGSSISPQPRGQILTAQDPLQVEEAEVPRRGTDVVRTYQLARWTDGRYHLWVGKQARTGRGEGSSGLRFDTVTPPL